MTTAQALVQRGMQPWLAPYAGYLIDVAQYNGLKPRITSVYRSRARQTQLYERYLQGKSKYPAAPPGRSYHEYGRAVDLSAENLAGLGALWQRMGGSWGGSRDPIHFQA